MPRASAKLAQLRLGVGPSRVEGGAAMIAGARPPRAARRRSARRRRARENRWRVGQVGSASEEGRRRGGVEEGGHRGEGSAAVYEIASAVVRRFRRVRRSTRTAQRLHEGQGGRSPEGSPSPTSSPAQRPPRVTSGTPSACAEAIALITCGEAKPAVSAQFRARGGAWPSIAAKRCRLLVGFACRTISIPSACNRRR